jgi:type II secretory pathway component PulM
MKKLKLTLKSREKRTLVIGAVALVLLALGWYLFFWENSLWAHYRNLQAEAVVREGVLRQMLRQERHAATVNSRLDRIKARMQTQGQGPALEEMLDGLVKEKAPSAEVPMMKPESPQTVEGLYRVNAVEVKLLRVPLSELVDLLYTVDHLTPGLKVRELKIKEDKNDPSLLEAEFVAVAGSPIEEEKAKK